MASQDKNLSLVLHDINDLRLEDRPIPKPGYGEVQIAVKSVGICGSDVSYWVKGRIGDFIVKAPMIMGHESAGVVSALGEGVTDLQVGDRVALEPGVPCRKCKHCKTGRYNLCKEVVFLATPPVHGNIARYHCHASDFCFKLPENVSLEEGALCEPLSVGIHACKRAGVTVGSKLLICGAGPIGLVSLLTAKAMGASEVVITDIAENRLEFAKKLGANYALNVMNKDASSVAKEVEKLLGEMPDITIECSGAESSIQLAILATVSGGCVVLVGLGPAEVKLPIVNAACREVDIRGIFRYCNSYPTAIQMMASGAVDVKPLVTHRFPIEKSVDAFEVAKTGSGGAIKVVIECDRK